ncbi:MAG: hypothetical protein LQ346_005077 [Caloplaca aetnensis]|nr:MAG: hypothetical protein LQ346_005077 [Caloplaca aetnensis]
MPFLRQRTTTFHSRTPIGILLLFHLFNHAIATFASSSQEFLAPPPADITRICPLPVCKTCPTARQIHAPGVGFALEMGYGYDSYSSVSGITRSSLRLTCPDRNSTAAIRFHNHTYHATAHVEGEPAFLTLMQRLATGPQHRVPHDIPSNWDKLRYLKRRTQRLLNRAIGRPATPETAILASMVAKLKTQIEHSLGEKVTTAVLSSPDRICLTEEEVSDVLDYLKIKNLMSIPDDLEDLYATSAAFAGYGFGLCRQYTDPYACEREEQRFPPQRLLHIDFTIHSLSGTIKSLNSARNGFADKTFISIDLGLGKLETSPEEEMYWTAVRDWIRLLVQSYKPRITQLMLTGSAAGDGRFREAVRDALYDLVSTTALDGLHPGNTDVGAHDAERTAEDFLYATAKGAAEFAKRRQEGPVRCAESEACKRVRKGIE